MKQQQSCTQLPGHNIILERLQGLLQYLVVICLCLAGVFIPAVAFAQNVDVRPTSDQQQWPVRITGTGTVTAKGETREAFFEILGDDEQARLIKMNVGGALAEIAVDSSDTGSSTGTGQFSPCDVGECPCSMTEIDGGIRGTCFSPAKPDEGELRFTMQIDGQMPTTQQWATLASGPGEVVAQGERREATFEILGDDEQARIIKINAEGMEFEIAVAEADVGGSVGRGQLSPCDGGDCPCTMTEIEDGIEGACSNRAYPEHGDMRFTMGQRGQQSPPTPPVVSQPPAGAPVAVSAKLRLQSDRIPVSQSDSTFTKQQLDIVPAIYLDITFSDGTTAGPLDYHKKFARNVIFDDITGDPNDIIKVSYWDVDSNRPDLGKFAAQLTSTGKGVGSATLKVSLRDMPGVTASIPVTVVGTPPQQVAPVPVVPPQSPTQNPARAKVPVRVDLSLRSNTIITRTSYFAKTYNGPGEVDPPIYLTVTFSDGTTMGPWEYQTKFADNLIFDDTSGDPNGLVHVSYWDVNGKLPSSEKPGPGRYAAQLSAPGYGTGTATLRVSVRNAPEITDTVQVTVVGAPERVAVSPPVVTPPPAAQPTPAQPQLTLITNGSGEFNDAGAEFGLWGLNGRTSEIRIQTGGRNYVFSINENSSDEDTLRGRLTPCSGGGCSCEMFEEGQNYYMGSCETADPQNQISFSVRIN